MRLRRIHQPSTTLRLSGEISRLGVAPRRALPAINNPTAAMTLAPANQFARRGRREPIGHHFARPARATKASGKGGAMAHLTHRVRRFRNLSLILPIATLL